MKHVIIDSDSLTYAAAFAVEKKLYAAVREYKDGEGTRLQLLAAEADYDSVRKLMAEPGVYGYSRNAVEPVEQALHALTSMLRTIREQIEARFSGPKRYTLLLTGSGNFRDRLATMARYKFNRVERAKPQHYGLMRKYLVDELAAKIVHWYEADDEAAIELTADPENTLVSSLDKDLLQVPGWHHIHGKGFLKISEQSGLLRFYMQALSGDSTDGVPGCKGIGAKKAQAIVLKAAQGASNFAELEREVWNAILVAYRQSFEKHGEAAFGHEDPEQAALETARLVYLLRERPKNPHNPPLWEPK